MSFSGENKIIHLEREILGRTEEQVEILERFRQDKRVHLILVLGSADVFHGRVTAGNPGVALKARHDFGTGLQIVRISSSSVQKVGRLNKFRPERVLAPVNLKVGREGLWQKIVPLHHQNLEVAFKDLETWPECQ